jgi:phosphatidylcholine synthase
LESFSTRRKAAAWGVHLYTAMGLPLALLSALALVNGEPERFWVLNCVAVFVDATDGTLARRVDVSRVVPAFDGRRLDDIVDFITFTFLPVLFIVLMGMFPAEWTWVAAAPLLASGYGFCQERAKTDESFVGFPSYWNIGVLYLWLLDTTPWVNLVVIAFFSLLVFVPVHYVYPTKTKLLKPVTLWGGYAWALTMLVLAMNPRAPWGHTATVVSLAYPVYYFVLSAVNHARQTAEPA